METVYAEISDVLEGMEQKSSSVGYETSNTTDLKNHILALKDQIKKERNDYLVSFFWSLNVSSAIRMS